MRNPTVLAPALLLLGVLLTTPVVAADHDHDQKATPPAGLKLENLLKEQLAGFEGGEVIVSRVTIPPHTSLPKHWHPGEEFGYVLEGACYLWQEGEEDILCQAGEAVKIPLEKVHTAVTKDEGATLLVFRVHESGKPERVIVE